MSSSLNVNRHAGQTVCNPSATSNKTVLWLSNGAVITATLADRRRIGVSCFPGDSVIPTDLNLMIRSILISLSHWT